MMELTTYRDEYIGRLEPIQDRKVVGFFCVNSKGEQYRSTEKIGYLRWKKFYRKSVSINLNRGQREAVRRTDKHDFTYYRYLTSNPSMVHDFSRETLEEVGFICNRQVLRKICTLPYQDQIDEKCSAFLYQGNIYLCFIKNVEPTNERMERCSRWGYKFEQHLLSSTPTSEPITDTPVIEGEEFACVFQSVIGNHRVMYAAEMDGIIIDNDEEAVIVSDTSENSDEVILKELNERKFVELKTSGFDENNKTFRKFKSKEIWAQSYFSGVESIVIGMRNYDGIVSHIRRYRTSDMIDYGEGFWGPDICLNFLISFLNFVKKCFSRELSILKLSTNLKEAPQIELLFERKVRSPVVLSRKRTDEIRPHLFDWFIKGVSVKSEK